MAEVYTFSARNTFAIINLWVPMNLAPGNALIGFFRHVILLQFIGKVW